MLTGYGNATDEFTWKILTTNTASAATQPVWSAIAARHTQAWPTKKQNKRTSNEIRFMCDLDLDLDLDLDVELAQSIH